MGPFVKGFALNVKSGIWLVLSDPVSPAYRLIVFFFLWERFKLIFFLWPAPQPILILVWAVTPLSQ